MKTRRTEERSPAGYGLTVKDLQRFLHNLWKYLDGDLFKVLIDSQLFLLPEGSVGIMISRRRSSSGGAFSLLWFDVWTCGNHLMSVSDCCRSPYLSRIITGISAEAAGMFLSHSV